MNRLLFIAIFLVALLLGCGFESSARTAKETSAPAALLTAGEQMLERQLALLAKQEQQTKRFDVVLDKWERQAER